MLVRHSSSPFAFSSLLLRLLRSRPATSDQGLTLLECLVAIVIIAITVVSITPPIFVATASRIQSRRAEQANAIAQAEIDRVRVVMERGPATETQLPQVGTGVANGVNTSVLSSPSDQCPTNKYPSPTVQASATQVIPVDVDGDGDDPDDPDDGNCDPEFAMQVVRANDCIPNGSTATVPYSFDLTVRVYGYKLGDAMSNLGAERMSLGLTTGRAGDDPTTGALRKPLQVLTTKVSRVGKVDSVNCVDGTP
ncbi:type II secretion system protein [Leptolyngbyaceae cyanobacterium UHCC 1019]